MEAYQLTNPGPAWVNLFYDLAWTATFSNLTQNGQFNGVWDTLSYVAFFVVIWWVWAAQALYNIHFYTDDWFHLVTIFFQMVVFGMLAATTRGFDVSTYIMHSPGSTSLDTQKDDRIDVERHQAEMTTQISMNVIAASLVCSRTLFLFQHLRVLAYAWITCRAKGRIYYVPWKLYVVPLGLLLSTTFFSLAWVVTTSDYGKTVSGAKLKFVLWGAGLIVEVFSHVRMSRLHWRRPQFIGKKKSSRGAVELTKLPDPERHADVGNFADRREELPTPRSNFNLYERLEAITTIILGEGINSISGTFFSVIAAPGLENPMVSNIACAALIVYFLAHFYFEGPTAGYGESQESFRLQVYSLLLHLPILLCVVLLLLGVKNQFLLASFLSTAYKERASDAFAKVSSNIFNGSFTSDIKDDRTITELLLNYGMSWPKEYENLINLLTKNGTTGPFHPDPDNNDQRKIVCVWWMRITLNVWVKIYKSFMGGDERIPSDTLQDITRYNEDITWPLEDYEKPLVAESGAVNSFHIHRILDRLLDPSIQSARYISALAGLILIFLGVLNLLQAKSLNRFQRGIIVSRFVMGSILSFLLLLNIGPAKGQKLWDATDKHAPVFFWLAGHWVLPTITLAFGVQFLVEAILAWLGALLTERELKRTQEPLGQMAWGSVNHGITKSCNFMDRLSKSFGS